MKCGGGPAQPTYHHQSSAPTLSQRDCIGRMISCTETHQTDCGWNTDTTHKTEKQRIMRWNADMGSNHFYSSCDVNQPSPQGILSLFRRSYRKLRNIARGTWFCPRHQVPPRSRVFLPCLLQAHFPTTSLGRLCCWSTCVDKSLRYVPALRSRSNIEFRSSPLPLCLFPMAFVFVTVPIKFAALRASLASLLSSVVSFATRPFISSFSPIPRYCSVWSFLACYFAGSVPFPSHRTHVVVCHGVARVLVTLCRLRIVRTFPRSVGTSPSSAVVSLMMISSFAMISSSFLGPVKNSRWMSFSIIFLTTNVFCASSTTLKLCSYSATFNDHAVSLSFNFPLRP